MTQGGWWDQERKYIYCCEMPILLIFRLTQQFLTSVWQHIGELSKVPMRSGWKSLTKKLFWFMWLSFTIALVESWQRKRDNLLLWTVAIETESYNPEESPWSRRWRQKMQRPKRSMCCKKKVENRWPEWKLSWRTRGPYILWMPRSLVVSINTTSMSRSAKPIIWEIIWQNSPPYKTSMLP